MTKKHIFAILIFCFLLLYLSVNISIADDQDSLNLPTKKFSSKPPDKQQKKENLLGTTPTISVFTLLIKVVFILIAIIIFFYVIRRFFAKKSILSGFDSELFKIIGVFNLGPGKNLTIVELGTMMLVLGITDNSINLIKEVKDKEEIDTIKLYSDVLRTKTKLSFMDYLKEILPVRRTNEKKEKQRVNS